MTLRETRRDFNALAPVYDETRQPLDPGALRGLIDFLGERHLEEILEIGVGTGRIALPLVEGGVRLVGLDASRGMLDRARRKGVPRLVEGSATRLPFADRAFDATLFVHVLHILDEPAAGLREAGRVGREGVIAVMDRVVPERDASSPRMSARAIVRQVLTEAGYPNLLRPAPRLREQAILEAHPPTEVRVVSDREVTEPLSRQIDVIEKRAYRHLLSVPPEALARAVSAARAQVGDRTVTYRRSEQVVRWGPESLPR